MFTETDDKLRAFKKAVTFNGPVQGHTHSLYKYPARFSPLFAKTAINAFTEPGDVVLDPFCGGGTTLVESRLQGRSVFGSDISSLAVFLAKTKTIRLTETDLQEVDCWFHDACERMNIHAPSTNNHELEFPGYDRNVPWRLRKLCEQYLDGIDDLTVSRQKRFARCVLLRCGQWALDCKDRIPSSEEFREKLELTYGEAVEATRQYRRTLDATTRESEYETSCRCVQASAKSVTATDFGSTFSNADLLVTSPPYPGVHVLYHRWNVRTRRETPYPFRIADCMDGHGDAHYTLGGRSQKGLENYYSGITESFGNLAGLIKKQAMVVQLVAFSSPEWQLPAYLDAMKEAGYDELRPNEIGLGGRGRLWRDVPGRRWYSQIRGAVSSSREVVLFHQRSR